MLLITEIFRVSSSSRVPDPSNVCFSSSLNSEPSFSEPPQMERLLLMVLIRSFIISILTLARIAKSLLVRNLDVGSNNPLSVLFFSCRIDSMLCLSMLLELFRFIWAERLVSCSSACSLLTLRGPAPTVSRFSTFERARAVNLRLSWREKGSMRTTLFSFVILSYHVFLINSFVSGFLAAHYKKSYPLCVTL